MDILSLISTTSLEEIIHIEEQDRQFLTLKRVWNMLLPKYPHYSSIGTLSEMKEFFLLLIVKNALISYQIAGSGEARWEEFSQKIESDFFDVWALYVSGQSINGRFYTVMTTSKHNKRLYNLKYKRLEKFDQFDWQHMSHYYQNMESLQMNLSRVMGVDHRAKTIAFAIKMYGYVARVVLDTFVLYPMSISIPVDSRIRKIFVSTFGQMTDREILEKAQYLSEQYNIPPLHLDSLLWVKR